MSKSNDWAPDRITVMIEGGPQVDILGPEAVELYRHIQGLTDIDLSDPLNDIQISNRSTTKRGKQ